MNKEEVYDSQIAPLMSQIIEVCNSNKIAMLSTFHLPIEGDEKLECTTALLSDEFNPPPQLVEALEVIRPPSRTNPMTITTRNASGEVIKMETII